MDKLIYIAGKVTGLPFDQVERKFRNKERELIAKGHRVINPVNVIKDLLAAETQAGDWTWEMKRCIRELLRADELHLLPCWQESKGAVLERDIAVRLEMPIVYP